MMNYANKQAKVVQDAAKMVAEIVANCPKSARLTFEFATFDDWYNPTYTQEIYVRSAGRLADRARFLLMAQAAAAQAGAADGWSTQFGQANTNPRLYIGRTVPQMHHFTEND